MEWEKEKSPESKQHHKASLTGHTTKIISRQTLFTTLKSKFPSIVSLALLKNSHLWNGSAIALFESDESMKKFLSLSRIRLREFS